MVEAVVKALIAICLVVLCAVLVVWVLGSIGLHLPPMVIQIFYVILALVCVLILFRILRPQIGGWLP